MTDRKVSWEDLTDPEIAAASRGGAMVAVPVGAIEQHASHLPVDTDVRSARSVALAAAARAQRVPVIVAPAMPFGFSPHHLSFSGTISLRLPTFLAVIRDVAQSIVGAGFRRVVLVNGHGGNSAPLRALVGEMVNDGLPVGAVDYFSPSEAAWRPMLTGSLDRVGHACEFETALAMHLRARENGMPTLVQERARDLPPRLMQPWIGPGSGQDPISAAGAAWPPIFQGDDCGYYGDPGAATPELGAKLFECVVAGLASFFDDFAGATLRLGQARGDTAPRLAEALWP